jgi:hypothetical protein
MFFKFGNVNGSCLGEVNPHFAKFSEKGSQVDMKLVIFQFRPEFLEAFFDVFRKLVLEIFCSLVHADFFAIEQFNFLIVYLMLCQFDVLIVDGLWQWRRARGFPILTKLQLECLEFLVILPGLTVT